MCTCVLTRCVDTLAMCMACIVLVVLTLPSWFPAVPGSLVPELSVAIQEEAWVEGEGRTETQAALG